MRLITRGDFDGLACAAVISSREKLRELILTHPQEILDGNVKIAEHDIIANLPYDPRCGMWFDNSLVAAREQPPNELHSRYAEARCAAELVWAHYGQDPAFADLVEAAAKYDSAELELADVTAPKGFILLAYTLDGRSGLGAYQWYFRHCLEWVTTLPIERVLQQPEVSQRVERLAREEVYFRQAVMAYSHLDQNVIFTDFRNCFPAPIGNRFLVYTLFPEGNVAVRVQWDPERTRFVVSVGHSIFNRTCATSIGELLLRYGGGGRYGAGGVQLPLTGGEDTLQEIVEILKQGG